MAQLYCTGSAHIYVGLAPNAYFAKNNAVPGSAQYYAQGGGATAAGVGQVVSGAGPFYLGTCEETPDPELHPEFEGVMNSLGGTKKPFDMSFQGEDALISLDLTRYNEAVYAALAARPVGLAGGIRGINSVRDTGTLMMTEGLTTVLWILFTFGASGMGPKPTMVGGAMPAGYRFPYTMPIAPERLGHLGTKNRKLHMVFYAMRGWNVTTGGQLLYDHNMNGLPAIN